MAPKRDPVVIAGLDQILEKRDIRAQQRLNGSSSGIEGRRFGLPAQPTALLGRDAELEALSQAILGGTRLLTLTGPGGVGKTHLAIELAGRVEHAFSDGAVLVDLTHTAEPDLVSSTIARALGVQGADNLPALDGLSRYLSTRRLLLLLDNFEHIVAAAPELGVLLARCSGLTVIVTSREPLHLRWEVVLPVPTLSLPDLKGMTLEELAKVPCIQLFVERAQAIRPEFALTELNARDVAELCVCLDGLPLAIELQAARVNVLTPSAMVARLNQRLSLLHRPAPDVPARQHSLEATLDWSYDLLSERERALLHRLAVFVGGFNLDMAAAVAAPDVTEVDVLEQLASLVDKSFVIPGADNGREPRFRLLETVRTFVLERTHGHDEMEQAREQHSLYFLALADQSMVETDMPRQGARFWQLDREYDNVRAALQWAAGRDGETELRLVIALTPFWRARGQVREGDRRLTDALARHPNADMALRVEALNGLANLLRWEGRFESAKATLDEALSLVSPLGIPVLVDRLLLNQGMLLTAQGETQAARTVLQQALARWQERGDTRGVALTIQYQGIVELAAGAYETAKTLLEESLSLFQQLGDRARTAAGLIVLSRLAGLQGDTMRAVVLLVEALRDGRELNDYRMMCAAVEQAAGLLAAEAQPGAVAELLAAADAARHVGGFVRSAHEESAYEDARAEIVARAGEQSAQDWLTPGSVPALEYAADRALALLADIASPPTRLQLAGTDTGKLSRREYEVLQFVAQGLSNKQIANVLLISENTVKYHVTSLLNKLGADSRAQIVALAAQLNLLQGLR